MSQDYSKKEVKKLVLVLLVLFIILGGFLVYVSLPLLSQKTVILSTLPVDPFDPIRGQYMVIGYDINTIPVLRGAEKGETIYVILEEDDKGISRYKDSSLIKPLDEVFIKGEIISISENNMRIEYGIEQYFFEKGAKFETRIDNVKVKLSDFGGSLIVELLDENLEPVKIEYMEKTIVS